MNLDFLMPLISDYPDQELVSFVELGVGYKADLEPLILLQPHLISFLPVQDNFLKEADKFVQRGWTEVGAQLSPGCPFQMYCMWFYVPPSGTRQAAMHQ